MPDAMLSRTYFLVIAGLLGCQCLSSRGAALSCPDGTLGVSAGRFGVVGDDHTDNTQALKDLHDYLVEHDGRTIVFPPGIYRYMDSAWLAGVRNVRLCFNGAALRNVRSTAWINLGMTLFTNRDYFTKRTGIVEYGVDLPHAIESQPSGSRMVKLANPAAASLYVAGDRMFVGGFNQQDAGFPPNLRYFEIHRVVSSNSKTGIVLIDAPLLNTYDARWPAQTKYELTNGPPYVVNLDRRGENSYTAGDHWHFEDVTMLSNPSLSPKLKRFGVDGFGTLIVQGVLDFECDRCKVGRLYVGCGISQRWIDSQIEAVEPDKLLDRLEFLRCKIGALSQATGINLLIVRDSIISSYFLAAPRAIEVTGTTFLGTVSTAGAKVCIGSGGTLASPVESAVFARNRFLFNSGDRSRVNCISPIHRFSVSAIISSTEIETSKSWDIMTSLAIGTVIKSDDIKAVVSNIVENEGKLVISVEKFKFSPHQGQVFTFSNVRAIDFTGNSVEPGTLN